MNRSRLAAVGLLLAGIVLGMILRCQLGEDCYRTFELSCHRPDLDLPTSVVLEPRIGNLTGSLDVRIQGWSVMPLEISTGASGDASPYSTELVNEDAAGETHFSRFYGGDWYESDFTLRIEPQGPGPCFVTGVYRFW